MKLLLLESRPDYRALLRDRVPKAMAVAQGDVGKDGVYKVLPI